MAKKRTIPQTMPWKPDLATGRVEFHMIGTGIRQYTYFEPSFVGPIGFLWTIEYGGKLPHADIVHCYTIPAARRCGVMRKLLNKVIAYGTKIITTQEGSKEGGEAFLRAFGFKFDQHSGLWVYRVPAKRGV